MATKDFLLPDLGEGLTEGEVVAWLVSVGDVIDVDQNIAEIETAKAVVEVPSPFGGTVKTLHAEPGEEIAVGSPLITIDVGGDDGGQGAGGDSAAGESGGADSGSADSGSADSGGADSGGADSGGADSGGDEDESGSVLVGYGTSGGGGSRRGRVSAGGGEELTPSPLSAEKIERDGRPMAKPPVRKMAKDLGVDLDYVRGSGPDGIITRADITAAAEGPAAAAEGPAAAAEGPAAATEGRSDDRDGTSASGAGPASPGSGASGDGASRSGSGESEEASRPLAAAAEQAPASVSIPAAPSSGPSQQRVPLNQMRRAIATQMGRSRREIPEAVTWVEADCTALWEFRKDLNASLVNSEDPIKVSALAIIMRMAVAGLRKFPSINSSLDTEAGEMVLHGHVNLGFAAQTDRGLVVPVIENAQDHNIVEMAWALADLASTARAGKLAPAQMSGGTFTVSNYGAFGVDGGDMVINHPEAAILGTGRITDKPWVVGGKVKVRKVITYSIAFDHRVIDGGEGAGFIRYLADLTENPTLLTAAL